MAHETAQRGLASLGRSWVLLATLLVPGCVLGLDTRGPARAATRPPPLAETKSPKPASCGPDCSYRPGYWHFEGGGYVWVKGHWERDAGLVVDSVR